VDDADDVHVERAPQAPELVVFGGRVWRAVCVGHRDRKQEEPETQDGRGASEAPKERGRKPGGTPPTGKAPVCEARGGAHDGPHGAFGGAGGDGDTEEPGDPCESPHQKRYIAVGGGDAAAVDETA